MNLREIKAQEAFGDSTSSLLDWRSNQLSYRNAAVNFIFNLIIINKINLRERNAQEEIGPSTPSFVDWRSNQLNYRAATVNSILLLKHH